MSGEKIQAILVVGGGIFGCCSAVELRKRGYPVSIVDPGPLPHPLAASTDISKAIRMDYGSDEFYMEIMEEALAGWRRWNREWGRPLFHEDGVMFVSRAEMQPGGFEYESYQLLVERGHRPVRIKDLAFSERFPAWNARNYPDGYFNPLGGWAESGEVVSVLSAEARSRGVRIIAGRVEQLLTRGSGVVGAVLDDGQTVLADITVLAAGSWSPKLLPELREVMWPVAQPVLHFRVDEISRFQPPHFVTWGADISNTGWYGFPALDDGTLKVANHGVGWELDPDGERRLPNGVETRFRNFLAGTFPGAEEAPLIGSRLCFYCDTWDGNFWVDRHPERQGLVVVTGGSGHGFKFAPMIGPMVADLVEEKDHPALVRFAWRPRRAVSTEEARAAPRTNQN